MSDNSKISWTEATWNPMAGCTPASEGCRNCYAGRMAKRLAAMGQAKYKGMTTPNGCFNGKINFDEEVLFIPLGWKKPRMIFVESMGDLFHEGVPLRFICDVFAIMGLASWHTFQVLTKRAERMAEVLNSSDFQEGVWNSGTSLSDFADDAAQRFGLVNVESRRTTDWRAQDHETLPFPNVWLGTSVENQAVKGRIDELRKCPAAIRFLSVEPLLEDLGTLDLTGIDWVIVGGESGPHARPCNIEGIRSIVRQCKAAGVKCFVKQLGAKPFENGKPYNPHGVFKNDLSGKPAGTYDRKGGDPAEWPEDLRVREMPEVKP